MIVCVCNAKNERAVREALDCVPNVATPAGLHRAMGCKPQCGRCLPTLAEMIGDHRPAASTCEAASDCATPMTSEAVA